MLELPPAFRGVYAPKSGLELPIRQQRTIVRRHFSELFFQQTFVNDDFNLNDLYSPSFY